MQYIQFLIFINDAIYYTAIIFSSANNIYYTCISYHWKIILYIKRFSITEIYIDAF